MDMQEAGELIRKHRKQSHLSQEQIARELHMSRSTISLIESGAVGEIGIRKFSQICARLGLRVQVVPNVPLDFYQLMKENANRRAEALAETSKILAATGSGKRNGKQSEKRRKIAAKKPQP